MIFTIAIIILYCVNAFNMYTYTYVCIEISIIIVRLREIVKQYVP